MTDVSEVVVIAKPNVVTPDNQTNPAPGPSGGGATAIMQHMQACALANVTCAEDVTVSEVAVVANALRGEIIYLGNLFLRHTSNIYNLPCIGNVSGGELASLIQRLKFKVTKVNYGTGRAGANNIGLDGANVPSRSI